MKNDLPFANMKFEFSKPDDTKTKLLEEKTNEMFSLLKGMSYEDIRTIIEDFNDKMIAKLFLS